MNLEGMYQEKNKRFNEQLFQIYLEISKIWDDSDIYDDLKATYAEFMERFGDMNKAILLYKSIYRLRPFHTTVLLRK